MDPTLSDQLERLGDDPGFSDSDRMLLDRFFENSARAIKTPPRASSGGQIRVKLEHLRESLRRANCGWRVVNRGEVMWYLELS